MKSLASFTVLLIGLVRVGVAQDPVVDTLDWHGYYPLQVGNAWEWVTDLQFFYLTVDRHEVVGDTLIDGKQYFVRQEIQSGTESGQSWVRVDTTFLRYDETRRVLGLMRSGSEEWPYPCDLGADFGSDIVCEAFGEVHVWGGFASEGACLGASPACPPLAAEKGFVTPAGAGSGTYYHGIGMVPGVPEGAQGGVDLTYVRVNGQEYGERVVYLDREETPRQPTLRPGVYPNPATGRVWLTLPTATRTYSVTLYDVLGRKMLDRQSCEPVVCELTVDRFPPGPYFARIDGADGPGAFGTFIIRR